MSVTVRNLTAVGGDGEAVRIVGHAADSFDLGSLTSPGNNVIYGNNRLGDSAFANLSFSVPANVTIYAVGNTWEPDLQGANADGHYSVPANSTSKFLELTTASGQNFVSGPNSTGKLRIAEIP